MQQVTTLLNRESVDTKRHQAMLELVVVMTALLFILWTDSRFVFPKFFRTLNTVLCGMLIGAIVWHQRPTLRQFGLSPRNGWFDGAASLAAFTFGAVTLGTIAGWCLGSIGQMPELGRWASKNWTQEGIQQLLLQVVLVPRLRILLDRDDWSVSAASALTFSLLHAPNIGLMSLTLLSGFVWCEWFRRYQNLPALWLSHFILAVTALWTLNPYLGNLRVGIGYLWSSAPRIS